MPAPDFGHKIKRLQEMLGVDVDVDWNFINGQSLQLNDYDMVMAASKGIGPLIKEANRVGFSGTLFFINGGRMLSLGHLKRSTASAVILTDGVEDTHHCNPGAACMWYNPFGNTLNKAGMTSHIPTLGTLANIQGPPVLIYVNAMDGHNPRSLTLGDDDTTHFCSNTHRKGGSENHLKLLVKAA